ncbi:MAG TPA: hypothetical protein PLF73_09725, partial [Luteimonas sp.]|nr:hypothetical protein [Luteimonas sp.]
TSMLATLGALLAAALVLQNSTALGEAAAPPSALRATELIIVDGAGVERVRVGGDLPDAVIDGRRIDRGSKVAGVMLYDRTGQERGGYVTFDEGDNIALTLDGRQGQNALFATGPDGATVMQVWHGRQSIEMRADSTHARWHAGLATPRGFRHQHGNLRPVPRRPARGSPRRCADGTGPRHLRTSIPGQGLRHLPRQPVNNDDCLRSPASSRRGSTGSVKVGAIGSDDLDVDSAGGDLSVNSIGHGDADHRDMRGKVDLPRKR